MQNSKNRHKHTSGVTTVVVYRKQNLYVTSYRKGGNYHIR